MFDQLVTATGPSGNRRVRTVVITASVVIHAAAVTALAIGAMWQIDKLELSDSPVKAAFVMPAPPPSGGSPPAAAALVPVKREPRKTTPKEPTQPKVTEDPDDPIEEIKKETTGSGTGTGTGTGTAKTGDGDGDDDGGDGDCKEEPCGEDTTKKEKQKIEEPKVKETEILDQNSAARLRTSGNDQIAAPNSVRQQMMRAVKNKVIGTVKLCVGTDGRVDSAKVLKSTGYDEYDDKLLSEMRAWKYRPYQHEGEATRFCTAITLVYIMK
jgi:TonB family protein